MKYFTTILLCLGVSRSGWAQCYPSCGCPQTSIQVLSPPSCCGNNGNGVSQYGDLFGLSGTSGCGCANSFSNFGSGSCGSPCSQPVSYCVSPTVSIPQPIGPCCSGQSIQPISSCCSAPAIQPASSCCCGPAIQPLNPCCLPAVPVTTCCSTPAVSSIGPNCGGSCCPLNSQSFAAALYQTVLGCPYFNNYLGQCGSNCGSCGPAPPCGCCCSGQCSPYYYASLCQLVLGNPYLRNLIQCNCPGDKQEEPNSGWEGPSDGCCKPGPFCCGPCNTCNFQFPSCSICNPCSCGFQIPASCPYKNIPASCPYKNIPASCPYKNNCCQSGGPKIEPYTDGTMKISEAESVPQKINTEGKKSQRYTLSTKGDENPTGRGRSSSEKRRNSEYSF
uniref:Uncharacterized protein n=1 Tax=Lygus hesperus TaxID=30085 RepID=A0A146LK27_LYGHE